MKVEGGEKISFVIFMIAVALLAVVYFTVPERPVFLENQLKWWREFWG